MRHGRKAFAAVICALLLSTAGAQIARRRVVSKGPRALGLVEVASDGRAMLVPVVIMISGSFYDASVYKADPVPMALQPETVYEGFKTGVSQGLFTVTTGVDDYGWIGAGKWKTDAQIAAEKEKRKERIAKLEEKPPEDDTEGGPPRLTRSPEKEHPPSSKDGPVLHRRSDSESDKSEPATLAPPKMSASLAEAEADRPILRREPADEPREEAKPDTHPIKDPVQIIPAISDAGGPRPRSYAYAMKPDEEQAFLEKMKAMAAPEIEHRAQRLAGEAARANKTRARKSSAVEAPEFHNVQLRVFDVSGTNEAVLVLTADAILPGRSDLQYSTAVAARQDIYGDLHRIFAQTTDNQHLDVQPRYELIDAVDADGDGRAELLFRQVWDTGSGYAVYRVLGDSLWPLYESRPSS
jgi:hypothetical protein